MAVPSALAINEMRLNEPPRKAAGSDRRWYLAGSIGCGPHPAALDFRKPIVHGNLRLFGSPTFAVDRELFWGDDRLEDAVSWHRHGRVVR